MKIETRYGLMSLVWLMHENKVFRARIWSVEPIVCCTHDMGASTSIRYRLEEHGKYYSDSELFPSKEALIASL
jgi:hypothetical protein